MVKLNTIPDKPGCYIYKDGKGIIIYVGKAISLKKRVSSYFLGRITDNKTKALVKHIRSMDYIVTKNEVEALILENNLIKKHMPRYNINLKDSKKYAYIMVTVEDFPRLLLARKKSDKGRFYGPFTSGEQRDKILKILRMIFKIRTCKKMPKRPCLRYHINLCNAPCIGGISREDYYERIKAIDQYLKGNVKGLLKGLQKKMESLSRKENFEAAIDVRDTINAIEKLSERQVAEIDKKHDQDVINYLVADDKVYLVVFNVLRGTLIHKEEFEFEWMNGFLENFISQYYSDNRVPKEVIVPREIDDTIRKYLMLLRNEQMGGTKVHYTTRLTVPMKGIKKELMDIALINLENSYRQGELSVKDLQKKLRMQSEPNVIECFDISNTHGSNPVGSMVQFRNGKPDKRNYRRFRIKTVTGIDDYSMIQEVVKRRYARLIKEDRDMPDLIVIDGGKDHLHAALDEMKMLSLKIPMISIAKQFEEVYVPGLKKPLMLDRKSYALKMLQRIRDEAHRFAITYHRLLRKKGLTG